MDPPAEQTYCGQEIPEPAMKAAIFSKLDRVSRERPEMQIMRPRSRQTDEYPHPSGAGRDSASLESLFIFRLSLSPCLLRQRGGPTPPPPPPPLSKKDSQGRIRQAIPKPAQVPRSRQSTCLGLEGTKPSSAALPRLATTQVKPQ
ncbi:hypothetical protein Trisim1_001355 [Trichoderma cf. simile WF8]